MPRSWVCWWLLLGGALLLGQPGSGAEEGSFGSHKENSEELEERARERKSRLETAMSYELGHLRRLAMDYFSEQRSGALYKEYVGATVKIQKTVGVMTTLDLFLAKTNCTKEEGLRSDPYFHFMDDMDEEPRNCVLPPESEQEKKKCTFLLFNHYITGNSVIDVFCEPLIIFHEQPTEDGEEAAWSMNANSEEAASSMNANSEEAASSMNANSEEAASSMNANSEEAASSMNADG